MVDGVAPVRDDDGVARVNSSAEPSKDDLESLRDAARTIPPQVLKDLLSNAVSERCIFRLFILHEQVCARPSLETRVIGAIIHELTRQERDGANCSVEEADEFEACRVCLGILQFVYNDDEGKLVKKNHATDFSVAIGDAIRKEGYQLERFSLEVSLPPAIVENEQAVRLVVVCEKKVWFSTLVPRKVYI